MNYNQAAEIISGIGLDICISPHQLTPVSMTNLIKLWSEVLKYANQKRIAGESIDILMSLLSDLTTLMSAPEIGNLNNVMITICMVFEDEPREQ